MAKRSRPYNPEAPTVPELSSGGLVLNPARTGLLLLHEAEEDRWCLPKGHVDPGETLVEAAEREIREEAGLMGLDLLADLGQITYRFYKPRRGTNILKVVAYFLFLSPSEEVHLEPIFDRHAWVPPGDAGAQLTLSERQVVERILGPTPPPPLPRRPSS